MKSPIIIHSDWLYILSQNLTEEGRLYLPPQASRAACSAAIGYNPVRIHHYVHPTSTPLSSLLSRTTCAGIIFVSSLPVPLTPPDCWFVGVRPLGPLFVGQ